MQNRSTDEIADAVCVQRQTSLKCRSGTHCSDRTTGWHWAWRSAMLVPRGCSRDCAQGSESAPAQPGPVAAGDHASRKRCVDPTDSSTPPPPPPTNLGMAVVPVNQSQPHWLSSAIFFFNLFLLLLLPLTLHSCTSLFLGFAFLRFYFVFYFFWFFCLRLGWMLWGPLNSKKSI